MRAPVDVIAVRLVDSLLYVGELVFQGGNLRDEHGTRAVSAVPKGAGGISVHHGPIMGDGPGEALG